MSAPDSQEPLDPVRDQELAVVSGQSVGSRVRAACFFAMTVTSALALALVTLFAVGTSASAATVGSVLGKATPTNPSDPDQDAVTVGMRFSTESPGSITAVRFFKGPQTTGRHVGAVYAADGELMSTALFTDETSYGWQSAPLSDPIDALPGETYTVATYMPDGGYGVTDPFGWPVQGAHVTGVTSLYSYGQGLRYPTETYQKSNYFVDVSFAPTVIPTPTPTPTPSVVPTPTVEPLPAPTPTVRPTPTPTVRPTPTPTVRPTPTPTVRPTPTVVPIPPRFADALSTGVPVGTILTPYTGPTTITVAGTVIDAKEITGCLDIRADNVRISRSLVQSRGCFFNILSDNGNTGMTLTDVEIDGLNNTTGDSGINGGGFTCLRCNIHGTVDGIKAQSNVVVQDSWIHDLAQGNDSHNDGIQSLGTTNLKILHNTIVLKDGATSAVLLSTGSASDMRNVLIDGNLLGGGAFTVYAGYESGRDVLSRVSNIAVTNNRFTTQINPESGVYGPLTSADPPVKVAGNTWHDGLDVGKIVIG